MRRPSSSSCEQRRSPAPRRYPVAHRLDLGIGHPTSGIPCAYQPSGHRDVTLAVLVPGRGRASRRPGNRRPSLIRPSRSSGRSPDRIGSATPSRSSRNCRKGPPATNQSPYQLVPGRGLPASRDAIPLRNKPAAEAKTGDRPLGPMSGWQHRRQTPMAAFTT